MKAFSEAVIRHRKIILLTTLVLCVLSVFAMQGVAVNYNLSDYLPKDAPSVQALGQINMEIPNLQIYLPGLDVPEALAQKEQIAQVPGVVSVLWLDDVLDVRDTPLEILNQDTLRQYYNEGPLYQVTVTEAAQSDAVVALRAQYPEGLFMGAAADHEQVTNVSMMQVASIMYYVVPLCLIILILATRHYLEPLLFLLVIGVAILLNEGTNIIFGSVSFITRACAAILQLAVSIDYAIFLLHRFGDYREEGLEPVAAMKEAMRAASSAITASAMTTIFGFLALLLMNFELGRDMGLVLAKGVLLSGLSVMIILPAISVMLVKWIDKTTHRSFLPSFRGFGRFVVRFCLPLAIVLLLALPAAFMMQKGNTFIYGSAGMHSPDSPIRQEAQRIKDKFSDEKLMLLLAPEGDRAKEARFSEALTQTPGITSVMSYANTVSTDIPPEVLPEKVTSNFYADGYARFIITTNLAGEGPDTFQMIDRLRALSEEYYPRDSHLLGEAAVNFDLKNYITADSVKVLLAGILSIGLVLLINFKNLSIPVILLVIIQGSIWLNMAWPYITGSALNYVGYQIVSSVQLGATVDYGILLSQRYLEGRQAKTPREAAVFALETATGSILPPAAILTLAGYALGLLVRDNGIISEMGFIIGRGAFMSAVMVLLVLPLVLAYSDRLIQKTTLRRRKKTP
ncbi:MAG TPA: MMPL family transporter [Clostridiales bacterium]|nr:MMPL family transporter [Clostridiales bacterium]